MPTLVLELPLFFLLSLFVLFAPLLIFSLRIKCASISCSFTLNYKFGDIKNLIYFKVLFNVVFVNVGNVFTENSAAKV